MSYPRSWNEQPRHQAPPPPAPKKSRKGLYVFLGIVGVLFIIGIANSGQRTSSAPTAPLRPASAPVVAEEAGPAFEPGTIPDGTWLVPSEVAPGQYRSTGPGEGLIEYCQVTTEDANGKLLEWKNAGQAGSQIIITVSKSAATVTNTGCGTFTKVNR